MPRQKSADEVGATIGRHLEKGDGKPLELDRVVITAAGRTARVSVPDATPEERVEPEAQSESASA